MWSGDYIGRPPAQRSLSLSPQKEEVVLWEPPGLVLGLLFFLPFTLFDTTPIQHTTLMHTLQTPLTTDLLFISFKLINKYSVKHLNLCVDSRFLL